MPIVEEEPEAAPLDMSWPGSCRERINYILVLPLILPLWLTLPDTRKESCKTELREDKILRQNIIAIIAFCKTFTRKIWSGRAGIQTSNQNETLFSLLFIEKWIRFLVDLDNQLFWYPFVIRCSHFRSPRIQCIVFFQIIIGLNEFSSPPFLNYFWCTQQLRNCLTITR